MEDLNNVKPLSETTTQNNQNISEDAYYEVLTIKEAIENSQAPYKQCTNDKDVLHDAEKIKITPDDDGSVTVISVFREITPLIEQPDVA